MTPETLATLRAVGAALACLHLSLFVLLMVLKLTGTGGKKPEDQDL